MNKRAFVKNTVVMTVTSLLLRVLGILFRIFISGRVGAEGMGLHQLIFSVYVLGSSFVSAGLTTAVTRLVAERLAKGDPVGAHRVIRLAIGTALPIGLALAAVFRIGAPMLGGLVGDRRTIPALEICGLALPAIGVCGCLRGYFLARRRAGPPCVSQIVEQVIRIGSILLMLRAAGSPTLAQACRIILWGDVLSETAGCLCILAAYLRDSRQALRGDSVPPPRRKIAQEMLHITLPLTAGRYLTTALRTAENVLVPARLTLFTHSTALSLEQFGAVKGMALPLLFFPAAFLVTISGLLVPELSDAHALGQKKQVAALVERTLQLTLPAAILIGCLFTVLGQSVGELLYHDRTTGLLLQILGPLAPIMYLDSVATGMLHGLGEQMRSLWYSVADSAVRILLIWLLLPRYGITGFLFVMLVSNILTAALSTHRLLTVSRPETHWYRWVGAPLLIAALCGGSWAVLQCRLPSCGWLLIAVGVGYILLGHLLLWPLFGCMPAGSWRRIRDGKLLKSK